MTSVATTNENGGATEVDTAVSTGSAGSIRVTDSAQSSDRPTWHQVAVGIARFLADFRERQSLDAEWEFHEMCASCRLYPAAHGAYCFSCLATNASLIVKNGALPS